MSNKKRPPSITYDGNVSGGELGQLSPPSKAVMQSRMEASSRTANQQQAVDARLQQLTSKAMAYVQQRTETAGRTMPEVLRRTETQAKSEDRQPAKTETLARSAIQRDNLRDIAREKTQEQAQQKEKNHER